MALADYFKGPKHKAKATRLEADLQALRQQSQTERLFGNSPFRLVAPA